LEKFDIEVLGGLLDVFLGYLGYVECCFWSNARYFEEVFKNFFLIVGVEGVITDRFVVVVDVRVQKYAYSYWLLAAGFFVMDLEAVVVVDNIGFFSKLFDGSVKIVEHSKIYKVNFELLAISY